MYRTLGEFTAALERTGELARVRAPVSPVLEIAEIADRESKSHAPNPPSAAARRTDPAHANLGGRALLFENVEGSEFPVLINAFGSYRRMEMALGCAGDGGFESIAARIASLVRPQPPKGLGEALAKARELLPLLRVGPRRVARAACQEVVLTADAIDLRRLPLIRCWPLDGDPAAVGYPPGVNGGVRGVERGEAWDRLYRGRYVTLAGVHTIHADDAGKPKPASHNVGMYRMQLMGPRLLAMHWHMHHDGARHWRSWKERGERMPVALALGGESVLPYAATCPLPPGISELLMAGFLNGGGVPMVRARTVPLRVPANSEIVIEGWVSTEAGYPGWDPRDPSCGPLGPGALFEGPFGDHTGFYSLPDRYPIMEVTAVTHRRGAVYPTTIVGLPPQEDYYLGKATERIMLPLLRTIIPDIDDYDLPMFGAFHNCVFIRIRKHYPLHARRVMHAVWGAGQMSWTKTVFVVDADVDVHDRRAVMEAAARWCDPARDVEIVHGPLDILDHAAPHLGAGTKMGFDCTRKRSGEEIDGIGVADGSLPIAEGAKAASIVERVRGVEGVLDARLDGDCPGWLLVRADKSADATGRAGLARRVVEGAFAAGAGLVRFVVVFGRGVALEDADAALFHWPANWDPGRDTIILRDERGSMAGFDATPKGADDAEAGRAVRDWPPLLAMAQDIRDRVSARWTEYGL